MKLPLRECPHRWHWHKWDVPSSCHLDFLILLEQPKEQKQKQSIYNNNQVVQMMVSWGTKMIKPKEKGNAYLIHRRNARASSKHPKCSDLAGLIPETPLQQYFHCEFWIFSVFSKVLWSSLFISLSEREWELLLCVWQTKSFH